MSTGHYVLYPSDHNFVRALVALVKTFQWSQISILTQNERPFLQVGYYLYFLIM